MGQITDFVEKQCAAGRVLYLAESLLACPGDNLGIFVWRNPELSQSVTVRPDGKISAPLVEDLAASGKTSTQMAREIEEILGVYVRDPLVTVIVSGFQGVFDTRIRVVGEAASPTMVPYSTNMTVLDLMITSCLHRQSS